MERKQKKYRPNQQAENFPSAELPTNEMLTDNTPTDQLPVLKFPSDNLPSERFPSLNRPIEDLPTGSFPQPDLSAKDLAMKQISFSGLPIENPPAQDLAMKQISFSGLPIENPPAQDLAAKQISFPGLPVENLPAQDLAAKRISLHGLPSKDLAAKKLSLPGLPVEDLPTRKISLHGLPSAQTPVEDLPTRKISTAGLSVESPPREFPPSTGGSQQSIPAKSPIDNKQNLLQFAGKCLLLLAFIGLATFGIFHTWSTSMAASPAQPDTFTELYFDNNVQLPSEIIPNHPYSFQFTLHNLEDRDMEYTYQVYLEVGNNKLIFDKGTVSVKENDYKTIQEKFATASVLPKSEIVVELTNKDQHIDFLIEGKA